MKNSTFLLLFVGIAAAATVYLSNIWKTGTAGFGSGELHFEHTYVEAVQEAKRTHKPIILIFSASWCGPCKQMKSDVYPSDAVKPYRDKFVWAYLDVDEPVNGRSAQQYNVHGIPHIEVVDTDGKSFYQQTGSSSPSEFAAALESAYTAAR